MLLIRNEEFLGVVRDLCHSFPGQVNSEDIKEKKWLKISPSKNVN
jgi:hypothetical protein